MESFIQNYLPIDDLSLLSLARHKFLVKFYFLSSYSV